MSTATEPLFDVRRTAPDPLAAAVRAIFPQASRVQVAELKELVAREAELIARPPKGMGAFR